MGVSARDMLNAIADGEDDSEKLANFTRRTMKKKKDELIIEDGRKINDENRTQMIKKLMTLLNINYSFEIDVAKDRIQILDMYLCVRAKNNILQKAPEIAAQWHPKKNGNLKPEYFPFGSKEKICDYRKRSDCKLNY